MRLLGWLIRAVATVIAGIFLLWVFLHLLLAGLVIELVRSVLREDFQEATIVVILIMAVCVILRVIKAIILR